MFCQCERERETESEKDVAWNFVIYLSSTMRRGPCIIDGRLQSCLSAALATHFWKSFCYRGCLIIQSSKVLGGGGGG